MARSKTSKINNDMQSNRSKGNRVNWQDFDKLIVIKKLRELVGDWWKVQMHFTDEKGFLRGVPSGKFFNPRNPITSAIISDKQGFQLIMKEVRKTAIDATFSNKPKLVTNNSGFSALLVPLKVKSQNLGCVFADGFLSDKTQSEQKIQIKSFLSKLFAADADKYYDDLDKLPILTQKDQNYLCELIKVVVTEMLYSEYKLYSEKEKVSKLKNQLASRDNHSKMIGKSEVMNKLYKLIDKVSDSQATVLVRGENGTGKELIARALHNNSSRSDKNFLVVNCGAFNDNLLESELFGHVKGSFTGANKDKIGLFKAADKGTLFLDEIGDTSLQMQVKLLRVLQEGTYTPVGATEVEHAKVRIIAATNRNLEQMIEQGLFRQDLYYRLNVILLEVPALRERKQDIFILAEYFLNKHAKANSSSSKSKKFSLSSECLDCLFDYNWPGNVRELENEMERLTVLSEKEVIESDLLSKRIKNYQLLDKKANEHLDDETLGLSLDAAMNNYEKKIIRHVLNNYSWNKSKVSSKLGLTRKMLEAKIIKFDLEQRTKKAS